MYSDDSKLLGEFLLNLSESGSFLEIGAGHGGNLNVVQRQGKFQMIVGTDILSLFSTRGRLSRDVELIQTDRATCFRPESFDIIVSNPPYVPSNGFDDITVNGGRGGMEKPLKFLSSALSVLKRDGKVAMVLSSEDSFGCLENYCKSHDLFCVRALECKLFFESLYVYLITRQKKQL